MSNSSVIIGIIVVIIVAALGFVFLGGGDGGVEREQTELQGDGGSGGPTTSRNFDQAPTFSLEDYDGNTVSPGDFSQKILVINAWATWCPFCVDELPDFGRLQQEFPDDVVVIAIDRSESRDRAKGFTDGLGISDQMTFLLDPKDTFYRSIGGFSMPETIFVDADGNIRIHKRGPMEFEEMKSRVESIINS